MFLSETVMRAIHADRVREIERATRERRLVDAARDEAETGATRDRWLEAGTAARRRGTRVPA